MSWQRGLYRVNPDDPRAAGQCDSCGFIYKRAILRPQMEYRGLVLRDTGFRVCPKCLDVPFEFNRPIRIPPDPLPITEPRPETQVDLPMSGPVLGANFVLGASRIS